MRRRYAKRIMGWKRRWPVMTQVIETREFPLMVEKSPVLRVLVVDDEFLIRWSVAETLAEHGYQVVEAGDALGACRALRDASHEFDVVLLDFRLPDSEDLSLLASIRERSPQT